MSQELIGSGELRSSADVRSAQLRVRAASREETKALKYAAIGDEAVFEGDIILGSIEKVERRTLQIAGGIEPLGLIVPDIGRHWEGGLVPFDVDPALPASERVEQAIAHWMQKTNVRFVKRAAQSDYVVFRPSDGCSSNVGRQGGRQFINLGPSCTAGNAIHEIGHTVGLWHEQSRSDRDSWIRIDFTNIIVGTEHNFDQHIYDGKDVGNYDYGSIMHYPSNAFARDATKQTITALKPDAQNMGQRIALSAGDILAVARIYG